MLIVGEVHTGLLRGRLPSSTEACKRMVDLVAGEPVLVSERPRSYVRSPERPVGVDCPLSGPGQARQTRGVGTVVQRSAITGGHVVQGSAYATVVAAGHTARQPWSHYLARPGLIETLGRTRWPELADAFAAPERAPTALNLGAVALRATDEVQRSVRGAGPSPMRAARTRMRWVAEVRPDAPALSRVRFDLRSQGLRLLRFVTAAGSAADVAAACEDVALHDWLLTTLIEMVHKAAIGLGPRAATLERLAPAVDHLLHLWMPSARADDLGELVWAVLNRRPGFARQWEVLANQIRDQLTVGVAEALSTAAARSAAAPHQVTAAIRQ